MKLTKTFIPLIMLVTISKLYAAPINIGIVSLEAPENNSSPFLAYATDGIIYEIDQNDNELIKQAKSAFNSKKIVSMELEKLSPSLDALEKRTKIESITLSSNEATSKENNFPQVPKHEVRMTRFEKNSNYNPAVLLNDYISDVDTMENAQSIFESMRQDTKKKSQCYNRAHAWSWEIYNTKLHQGKKVQPGKIWIFFTKKYVRDYKYKWWFHIAPYLKVNKEDMVIDREYSNTPQNERQWTNTYISDQSHCPQVARYSDYKNNQWSSYCYVMKTSVHYWQPFNIENAEKRNFNKAGWRDSEVQAAYNNAVKGYREGFMRRILGGKTAPYLKE